MQESGLPVSVLDMAVDFLASMKYLQNVTNRVKVKTDEILNSMSNYENPGAWKKFRNKTHLIVFLKSSSNSIKSYLLSMVKYGGSTLFDTIRFYPSEPAIKKVYIHASEERKLEYFNLIRLLDIIYHVRELYEQKSLYDNYLNAKLFLTYNLMKKNLVEYLEFTLEKSLDDQGPASQDLDERFVNVDVNLLKTSFGNLTHEEGEELEVLYGEGCFNNILFLTLAAPVLVHFEEKVESDVSLRQDGRFSTLLKLTSSLAERFPNGFGALMGLRLVLSK